MKKKCQWFGCKEKATVLVERANLHFCEDHYILNCLRSGCDLKGKVIGTGKKPSVTNE